MVVQKWWFTMGKTVKNHLKQTQIQVSNHTTKIWQNMKLSNVFCLGCFSLPRIGDLQASTKGPIFFLPVSKTLKTNITILLPNSESTRGLFCAAQNWLFFIFRTPYCRVSMEKTYKLGRIQYHHQNRKPKITTILDRLPNWQSNNNTKQTHLCYFWS